MPHMLLIIEPVGQRATRTEAEGHAAYDSMTAFAGELAAAGLLAGAESLRVDASRVQVRSGRTEIIDGPFAEAKEMIGGYFMLATEDRQQALDIAARCPAAAWATVEVRSFGPCFDDSHAPG